MLFTGSQLIYCISEVNEAKGRIVIECGGEISDDVNDQLLVSFDKTARQHGLNLELAVLRHSTVAVAEQDSISSTPSTPNVCNYTLTL